MKKESLEISMAKKETGIKRLIYWGTQSIKFEKDHLSFFIVIPGFLSGILYQKEKKK